MKLLIGRSLFGILLFVSPLSGADLKGYYTRTDYDDSHSGKWADVIVEVSDMGRLVFGRETGFLPVWETDSGEWHVTSLVDRLEDPHQYYTYVRMIVNTADSVWIHVRYMVQGSNGG